VNKKLSANTTLSHYRILSLLGAGGMGEVYLGSAMWMARSVMFARPQSRTITRREEPATDAMIKEVPK
jgi:serine/threonine protein kinase